MGLIGDATNYFVGYVPINSSLVNLVVNRGYCRSEGLWLVSFFVVAIDYVGGTALVISV